MLKYVNTGIVFQEVPDEVALAVNISRCPCHCPGCHSNYLWQDIGTPLTPQALDDLIARYGRDITCVAFMGGDAEPETVVLLADYVHEHYAHCKVAWYSGRQRVARSIRKTAFDYIKLGPYLAHLGPLKSRTTNQRFYKKMGDSTFADITHRFWEKAPLSAAG